MSAVAALSTTFMAKLVAYFAGRGSTSIEESAQTITEAYVDAMKVGFNPLTMNKLHPDIVKYDSTNAKAFKNAILTGFTASMADVSPGGAAAIAALTLAFNTAPIAFWTGAKLEGTFRGMPPGHTGFVPIINVVSPGVVVPPIIILPQPQLPAYLPTIITAAYTAHLATITFLCPAAFLPYPSPPYPLPLVGVV